MKLRKDKNFKQNGLVYLEDEGNIIATLGQENMLKVTSKDITTGIIHVFCVYKIEGKSVKRLYWAIPHTGESTLADTFDEAYESLLVKDTVNVCPYCGSELKQEPAEQLKFFKRLAR
jgi:hypothetical protein